MAIHVTATASPFTLGMDVAKAPTDDISSFLTGLATELQRVWDGSLDELYTALAEYRTFTTDPAEATPVQKFARRLDRAFPTMHDNGRLVRTINADSSAAVRRPAVGDVLTNHDHLEGLPVGTILRGVKKSGRGALLVIVQSDDVILESSYGLIRAYEVPGDFGDVTIVSLG